MKSLLCFVLSSFLLVGVSAQTQWNLDKNHSKIRFTVTHLAISEVEGQFNDFSADITSTSDDFNNATVEFTAQVASIDTDNQRRDGHLKSADFFAADSFPEITFKGKLVKEEDQYHLVGDFTMRGTTKPVKFDVKYGGMIEGRRGMKAGFKVEGEVNRFDYGLHWDRATEAGGLVVGEMVKLTANVEINSVVPDDE